MKNHILIILAILTLNCCKKNDDDQPVNPISQLPPATQTGENTFGCLLDGEPFLPGGGVNPLDCVYQFTNGGYYFALQGNKVNNENLGILIGLGSNDLQIHEMQTYILEENIPFNASGTIALNGIFSETDNINSGELTITRLDETNQIVSGTFFFDILDFNGELREIREGRFDMQYTQ